MTNTNVLCSVRLMTYNHEKYVARAVESVLMQRTNFKVELVVGNDFSTDKTMDIIRSYRDSANVSIRILDRREGDKYWTTRQQLGRLYNFVNILANCKGKYVALLDGDDYWTSPDKLQKQVDFLNSHPDCAISFHNCEEFYDDGSKEPWLYCSPDQKAVSTIEDLLVYNFIPTCSAVFRNGLFGNFPDWYYSCPIGDWPLHILNAQYGSIGYINAVMGRHRHHAGGVWSLRNQAKNILDVIKTYKTINQYFNYKYNSIISTRISAYHYDLFTIYINNGEKAAALKNLYYSFNASPITKKISTKYLASLASLLKSFFINRQIET